MNKQAWTINLLCVLSLIVVGWKLTKDWREYAAGNGPRNLVIQTLSGVAVPAQLAAPDYTAIARQNPFHPERNDVIEEPAQAKMVGPPPLVYGSIILGSSRFALLGTEQSTKPERVPEGSTFAGYHLVQVRPQSVIFDSGTGSNEIMFYNALERLHRQAGKTTASAKPPSQPPAVSTASGQIPLPPEQTSTERGNSPPPSPDSKSSAQPAPAGKEWKDTPFGPMLFDKKKP